jgi:hypothetical protein
VAVCTYSPLHVCSQARFVVWRISQRVADPVSLLVSLLGNSLGASNSRLSFHGVSITASSHI